MLGDILLISDQHRKAGAQIASKIRGTERDKLVVAIGGESGSGKSELAHVVSRTLKDEGRPAKILHTDNYYKVSPRERTAWRQTHGVKHVGLEEYNWELLARNVDEFREDQQATLPCIDLLTDQEDRLITDFHGIPVLILEGLYAVHAEADLKIFIDLTYHVTKKAQIVRRKEPQNEFRLQVLQREHEVVRSLRPEAHLIVTPEFDVIPAAG